MNKQINLIGIHGKIGSGKDYVGQIIQYLVAKSRNGYTNPNNEYDFTSYIRNEHNLASTWKIKKYAGKLKQIVSILTGISVEDMEKEEVKSRELGDEWYSYEWVTGRITDNKDMELPINKPTVRQMLQQVGTDAMRYVIHPNVWVNALFVDYNSMTSRFGFLHLGDTGKGFEEKGKIDRSHWIITDVRFPNEAQAIKDRGGILIKKLGKSEGNSTHPSETALDGWTDWDAIIDYHEDVDDLVSAVKSILIKEGIINN